MERWDGGCWGQLKTGGASEDRRSNVTDIFETWFERVSGYTPHTWQRDLGDGERAQDRLIRIPTGFGKTAGVVLCWLYHRVIRQDSSWPTRLVFMLPMRVLVEQTSAEVRNWLKSS